MKPSAKIYVFWSARPPYLRHEWVTAEDEAELLKECESVGDALGDNDEDWMELPATRETMVAAQALHKALEANLPDENRE